LKRSRGHRQRTCSRVDQQHIWTDRGRRGHGHWTHEVHVRRSRPNSRHRARRFRQQRRCGLRLGHPQPMVNNDFIELYSTPNSAIVYRRIVM